MQNTLKSIIMTLPGVLHYDEVTKRLVTIK